MRFDRSKITFGELDKDLAERAYAFAVKAKQAVADGVDTKDFLLVPEAIALVMSLYAYLGSSPDSVPVDLTRLGAAVALGAGV